MTRARLNIFIDHMTQCQRSLSARKRFGFLREKEGVVDHLGVGFFRVLDRDLGSLSGPSSRCAH